MHPRFQQGTVACDSAKGNRQNRFPFCGRNVAELISCVARLAPRKRTYYRLYFFLALYPSHTRTSHTGTAFTEISISICVSTTSTTAMNSRQR